MTATSEEMYAQYMAELNDHRTKFHSLRGESHTDGIRDSARHAILQEKGSRRQEEQHTGNAIPRNRDLIAVNRSNGTRDEQEHQEHQEQRRSINPALKGALDGNDENSDWNKQRRTEFGHCSRQKPPTQDSSLSAANASLLFDEEFPGFHPAKRVEAREKELHHPPTTMLQAMREYADDKPHYTGQLPKQTRLNASSLEEQLVLMRQRDEIYQEEATALLRENNDLQARLNEARTELNALHLENRELQFAEDKVRRLERYLQTVPTDEEFQAKCEEIAKGQQFAEQLEEELRRERSKAHESATKSHELESQIHLLKREIESLRGQLIESNDITESTVQDLRKVVKEVSAERDQIKKLYDQVTNDLSSRIAETKAMHHRLEAENAVIEDLRLQVATKNRDIQELQEQARTLVNSERHLRSEVVDTADVKDALLKKLAAHASTIQDLRESIDVLSSQNQTLIHDNQLLRAGQKSDAALSMLTFVGSDAERKASGKATKSEVDKIQDELSTLLQSFAKTFDLAIARLNNSDEDVRRLLGLSPRKDVPLFVRTTDVESRLQCIREMQQFVDSLNQGVNDAYAQDVGQEACHIQ